MPHKISKPFFKVFFTNESNIEIKKFYVTFIFRLNIEIKIYKIAGDVPELSLLEDEDVENIKLSGIINTEFKENGNISGKFSGDGYGYYNSIPISMASWFSGEVEYVD